MTFFKKTLYTIGVFAIPILLAAWLISDWLVADKVPSRPRDVGSNAVFLWAPAVGFPGGLPRRGWWLACSETRGHDYCELSDIDGRLEYEGEYVRYGDRGTVSDGDLQIDASKSEIVEKKVWVGDALVPLAYLKNGEILVPATEYDQAAHLLTDSNSQPNR